MLRQVQQWLDREQSLKSLWLVVGLLLLLLGFWEWQLSLALLVGIALVAVILGWPEWRWRWQQLVRWLSEQQLGQVVLAVVAGSAMVLICYTVLEIATQTQDHWVGIALAGQGLATVGLLAVLAGSRWQQSRSQQQQHLAILLQQLTALDPIYRLTAIRQIQEYFWQQTPTPPQILLTLDSLKLALEQEQHTTVRGALLDALDTWQPRTLRYYR